MSKYIDEKLPPVQELTSEEWWEVFDRNAREWLGISGEEFIRRYQAGEITAEQIDYDSDINMLYMMMPYGR